MSWAEIKKAVNSNLDVPLDYYLKGGIYKFYKVSAQKGDIEFTYSGKSIIHSLQYSSQYYPMCKLQDFIVEGETLVHNLYNESSTITFKLIAGRPVGTTRVNNKDTPVFLYWDGDTWISGSALWDTRSTYEFPVIGPCDSSSVMISHPIISTSGFTVRATNGGSAYGNNIAIWYEIIE